MLHGICILSELSPTGHLPKPRLCIVTLTDPRFYLNSFLVTSLCLHFYLFNGSFLSYLEKGFLLLLLISHRRFHHNFLVLVHFFGGLLASAILCRVEFRYSPLLCYASPLLSSLSPGPVGSLQCLSSSLRVSFFVVHAIIVRITPLPGVIGVGHYVVFFFIGSLIILTQVR